MKLKIYTIKNSIFFVIILLLIIPNTRLPIQVFLNKGLALFSPSLESNEKQITDYNWKLASNDNSFTNLNKAKGKVSKIIQ